MASSTIKQIYGTDATLTAGTNVSIARQNSVILSSKVICIAVSLTASSSISANATLLTLPSGYSFDERTDMFCMKGSGLQRLVASGTTIVATGALSANDELYINGVAKIKRV